MADKGFSAAGREEAWTALGETEFDLVVIGGGITGAGVARDAAGRGMEVALLESHDIGGGTSSRSSRLAHGGLRYLETYDFHLVFEALRERRRLLELAPHLVRPLPFLYPVFEGDPTGLLKLTAGMWLYDSLALFRSPHRHRMLLRRDKVLAAEPRLRTHGLKGGAVYYDAQLDDARLTLAVAKGAAEAGATIVSRARVVALDSTEGSIRTVTVRDLLNNRSVEVRTRVVLNATGPWSDRVRRLADPTVKPRLRTTKGTHLLVDRRRIGNRNAVIFRSPADGRVMFVLPWGEFTYIGTTDTEFAGDPESALADVEDVQYLLTSTNAIFPSAALTTPDVLSTWAGVRPLLAPARQLTESATSREHAIWRDPSGLLNIAGGKLTTFRSMAAETTDAIARILRDEFAKQTGRCYTEYLPIPGAPGDDWENLLNEFRRRAVALDIERETLDEMIHRYGTETEDVLALAESEPGLAKPLIAGRPYLRGEVVYAVREGLALKIEDVLRRRLQVFYVEPDGGKDAARRVAKLMANEEGIGWTAEEVAAEIESYDESVESTRPSWRH